MRAGPAMTERVLISTHDLPLAGRLRSAVRDEGYRVEFVTPDEELVAGDDLALLILTGGTSEARPPALFLQAADVLDLPVMAVLAPGAGPVSWEGLAEILSSSTSADEVSLIARRLMERHRLQEITGIVGESDAIREALERVVQIAPVASTVLITGESGTGKELIARGIHGLSPRRHKPFIAVNVAALSDTLLESELFGHEKGAFTGAVDARKGLFQLANQGTIFLDEIGEMPLATQTKLLRVLEQREFYRVGGEVPISVDVRIIGATNQDLRRLVQLGDFRKDLYYRLNVLQIALPPLRERRSDIPRLIHAFVREVTERNGRPFYGISEEAMEILRNHRWPGNVRELRNLVESMVVLAPRREIAPADIPDEVRLADGGRDLLPVHIPRAQSGSGDTDARQQMEFIFRTLVDLRMDVDDLRKEFDVYRADGPTAMDEVQRPGEVGRFPVQDRSPLHSELSGPVVDVDHRDSQAPDPGTIVYRSGMTMEDLEREALVAALAEVNGNRRKAAEMLDIGERTLYRKIRKYGLED